MNTYKVALKGTKKNGTSNFEATLSANNKLHAFNLAYLFFQKGETAPNVTSAIANFAEVLHLAGKYTVARTAVVRVK